MSENPQQVETKLQRAWQEYADATLKAQRSLEMEDGIEAGRAWSRWLSEFCPDGAVKHAVHGNIRRLPR